MICNNIKNYSSDRGSNISASGVVSPENSASRAIFVVSQLRKSACLNDTEDICYFRHKTQGEICTKKRIKFKSSSKMSKKFKSFEGYIIEKYSTKL